jgi:hypothetical protein
MPSLPHIPVVTVAPAPMIILEATVSGEDRTSPARPNSIRPEFSHTCIEGERVMVRRSILGGLLFLSIVAAACTGTSSSAQAAEIGQPYDWGRFYYYPYVYYPHNFYSPVQFDNLYYRYPQERQIPVYNRAWHNFYISEQSWPGACHRGPRPGPVYNSGPGGGHPYYKGAHFILDVF